MSEKKLISTTELIEKEWYTGISDRDVLNSLDMDELLSAIHVELSDELPIHCSDAWFDTTHKEYVVCFARG